MKEKKIHVIIIIIGLCICIWYLPGLASCFILFIHYFPLIVMRQWLDMIKKTFFFVWPWWSLTVLNYNNLIIPFHLFKLIIWMLSCLQWWMMISARQKKIFFFTKFDLKKNPHTHTENIRDHRLNNWFSFFLWVFSSAGFFRQFRHHIPWCVFK